MKFQKNSGGSVVFFQCQYCTKWLCETIAPPPIASPPIAPPPIAPPPIAPPPIAPPPIASPPIAPPPIAPPPIAPPPIAPHVTPLPLISLETLKLAVSKSSKTFCTLSPCCA